MFGLSLVAAGCGALVSALVGLLAVNIASDPLARAQLRAGLVEGPTGADVGPFRIHRFRLTAAMGAGAAEPSRPVAYGV